MPIPEEKVEQGAKKPAHAPDSAAPKHSNYLLVFFALAALTGLEIAVTQFPLPRAPILIPLAFLKAGLVALFYMHLRYDSKLFSAIFVAGLLLGAGFIVSMLIFFGAHEGMSGPPGIP